MKEEQITQRTGEEIVNSLKALMNNGGPKETEYLQLDTDILTLDRLLHTGVLGANFLIEIKSLFSSLLLENTVQGWGFRKPYGYPGDFKMIDYIYTKHHSDNPDFVNWDKYFHYHQAPKAVRNRKEYFKKMICNQINGKPIDLLNVASGPARDLKECYDLLDDKSQLIASCVELDIRAIDFAKDLCKDYLNYIEFINKNILKFNTAKRYDIIWSAGLFDYFNDRTFILILKKLNCLLKPDGEILVGNFCKSNPSKAYMEIFGEWFLFHRTEAELTDLALCAGFEKDDIFVDREPLGINLFLRIKKSSSTEKKN